MRVKSFGHGQLKGHLQRGSEINKARFGHSRTHYSPPTTHAVSRLYMFIVMFIVITLIFWYESVLLGRRVVYRKFTISVVEVTTSIVV